MLCTHTLLELFIYQWAFRLFPYLVIGNNAAVNVRMHVSFWSRVFLLFRWTPRSGIAGSYGSFMFSFMRNLHTVFHGGCTNFHSHQLIGGFPFLHILSSTYCCLPFWWQPFIVMRWCFIVLFITIFLLISNVEHLFMCLLAVCMFLLEKNFYSDPLSPFPNEIFNLAWEILGWTKHKLESRLPGEISITSDIQMTPPLWQKVKRN